MSIQFNPDDHIGQQLTLNLTQELRNRFGIDEDANDIAEFIVILMASNRHSGEILSEIKSITDIPIEESFIQLISNEAARLVAEANGQSGQQMVQQPVAPSVTIEPQHFESAQPPQPPQPPQPLVKNVVKIPEGPKSLMSRTSEKSNWSSKGGIHKSVKPSRNFDSRASQLNNSKKSFALKNPENLEKMLNLPNNQTTINKFPQKPKGRCNDFPYCENKDCQLAHPTRNCFAYPNCPNPPGTCNYLHPDEDQELMAKLEKSRKEFNDKKQMEIMIQQGSCKFGKGCTKDTCPFAHPTPANLDGKITTLDWCSNGKNCQDVSCTKAHPPPPTAKPVTIESKQEIALEQCKFGASCTNYKCLRRHATSAVPCRAGSDCKRLDCFFSHPIPEPCRFGEKCTNKNCQYQHPETRVLPATSWSKDSASGSGNSFTFTNGATSVSTNNRAFAVPDDQVMEQAVQD